MIKLKKTLSITILLSSLVLGINFAYAGPKMQFSDTAHDFGEVDQKTSNKHVFKFKNGGDEDLEIINVKPSCGCTAALLSSKIIKPGESGEIEVNFNASKFKGKVKKTVSVETNEEPVVRKEPATPGLGPRIIKEIKEPTRVHKLFITATVKYDPKKEQALKRAREEAMKKSKKERLKSAIDKKAAKKTAGKNLIDNIDYQPKKIDLGTIKLNEDYKIMITLKSLSQENEFIIDKVSVSAPYTSAMIAKLNILPDNPGEVSIAVKVNKAGEVKGGNVYIYVKGVQPPISIPVSWNAE
jgi:hypothetical protein